MTHYNKWALISLFGFFLITYLLIPSTTYAACTDSNCGTMTCATGFERDREGCKICRCTPSPKITKDWTFNATIDCPAGTVLTQNMRFFSASWTEGQNLPNYFYWDYTPYSRSVNQTLTLHNYTPNDTLFFGIESDVIVAKSKYWGGISMEAMELIPTGVPPHSALSYQKAFNPYTNMVRFTRETLPPTVSGNPVYPIHFAIPEGYNNWCAAPTPIPTSTPAPTRPPTPIPTSGPQSCSVDEDCPTGYTCLQDPCPPHTMCLTWVSRHCYPSVTVPTIRPTITPSPTPIRPTITPSPTPTPPDPCARLKDGDVDCSGTIDEFDFNKYKALMNGESPTGVAHGDVNADSKMDLVDFDIWRNTMYP